MDFVGNATTDEMYFVPRLPVSDEVAAASRRVTCLGGRGVVPALVTAALGVDVELCTMIGATERTSFESFLTSTTLVREP